MIIGALAWPVSAFSQAIDSVGKMPRKSRFRILYEDAWKSIQRDAADTAEFMLGVPDQAEKLFLPFQGKKIRQITLIQRDFDHQIMDTSRRLGNFVTRAATRLHATTKPWVLYNHLFLREGEPLNAYQVADNERFLRSQPFIQDVRILPKPVEGDDSQVDLLVYCKDVFSLGGDIYSADASGFTLRGYDANFLGMAQRLQVSVLHGLNRSPQWGFDASISRSSLGGSFINGQIGYTTINTGKSLGNEDEKSAFIRFDRPMPSPDALTAGRVELSHNESINTSVKPDDSFYRYRYNVIDFWAGLNFTAGTQEYRPADPRRLRKFLAIRYFDNYYTLPPTQVANRFDPVYNSRQAFLTSLTIFRLQYFRTRYFYGFGLTEDLPRGLRLVGTGGWSRQNGSDRPYLGFDMMRYTATESGDYFQTFFRTGGFFKNQNVEDIGVLLGVNAYSRLIPARGNLIRQRVSGSVTLLRNRTGTEPLRINNELGLPDFGAGNIMANSRGSLWSETMFFLNKKLFGIRFAPFAFGGYTLVSTEKQLWHHPSGYSAIGAGVRMRNENLIFGTVEVRGVYFPRLVPDVTPFNLTVTTNLRYRYNDTYVRPPDILNYNDNN